MGALKINVLKIMLVVIGGFGILSLHILIINRPLITPTGSLKSLPLSTVVSEIHGRYNNYLFLPYYLYFLLEEAQRSLAGELTRV